MNMVGTLCYVHSNRRFLLSTVDVPLLSATDAFDSVLKLRIEDNREFAQLYFGDNVRFVSLFTPLPPIALSRHPEEAPSPCLRVMLFVLGGTSELSLAVE